MCLFKKLKPKEVYDYLDTLWTNAELKELPKPSERNDENFTHANNNSFSVDDFSHTMKLLNNKWRIDYSSFYEFKKGRICHRVCYLNLIITDEEVQKTIKKSFKQYEFQFGLSYIVIYTKYAKVRKLEDVKKSFEDFISGWASSGLYDVFDEFPTSN